ncbi:aminoglycoside phosphotransferase family protein [Thalassorhabdomicrobium marinisediminis]|uniref:Phosphotransferase n=1 Tax=Thalassorhabdomicrobium marinisediminis TaxID=2170577 RepID=A0A2T7FZP4_9RHOB|nr:phosphotransferase [Thalassorhabdomicrobium marinisediminis]PVA07642.1 phosphotransferase [Thalassorhabdomicrobium marinisediminis]
MSAREALVQDWLAGSPWAAWQHSPITGDASARRYLRLTDPTGGTVILMDAPPDLCGSQNRFAQMADHLRGLGLAAPEVLAFDDTLGVMVLEDLGPTDFARHLRHTPQDERPLYEAGVDVLKAIGAAPPPSGLDVMTPQVGGAMIDLAFDWAAQDDSASLRQDITAILTRLLQSVSPAPATLSLRDFHAENLIWRPEQAGGLRIGLLDFQDAFVTHPAYDLASLLRDARRDVDPSLVAPLLARLGPDHTAAFHIMAVQRNLRILGIFNRLARRDAKPGYLALVPRVRAHLATDLRTPYLAPLAPLVDHAFGLNIGAA